MNKVSKKLQALIRSINNCQLCADHFEHKPRPVIQLSSTASILVAGQAPGLKVHNTGIPFNDASGDRLREWMGISREIFYDASKIAILPMGFCYPGRGTSGDLPPRPECAQAWRQQVLDVLPKIQLTLVIGRYAIDWHLGQSKKLSVTEMVKNWQSYGDDIIPMPHPSPRNNRWLSNNPWFERDLIPVLQRRVRGHLGLRTSDIQK